MTDHIYIIDKSIRYLRLGLGCLNPMNALVLSRNLMSLLYRQQWENYIINNNLDFTKCAIKALNWIKHSQDVVGSGGVGCFHFYHWTKGYPEVTGYIIPTFWDAFHLFQDEEYKVRALRMADWEISIQRKDGGWEGNYQGDKKPSIVFNSGQVIRGLIRTYKETEDLKYLSAAKKCGDWIVKSQEEDGSWTRDNFMQMKRVYDTYVSAALSELYEITNDPSYYNTIIRNCEFTISNQSRNGWFDKCDNSLTNNDAPLTHTLCYTIDGLIETGIRLKINQYIESAKLAAEQLMHKAEILPILSARFDKDWKGRVKYSCITGNAQLGVILMKLFEIESDKRYLNTALKLADFLAYVQSINSVGKNRSGGLTGSYPIWGAYSRFNYPSWASKYFIDLLFYLNKYAK